MPFLRFTRDKRGYETTSLVHAFRHRGRARQRILYWFRTPPGVKVGRPALDEDAIRWIEEHNTDIEFNWEQILEAQPPPTPSPDDGKNRRVRRDRAERGDRGDRRRQGQPPPARPPAPRRQPAPVPPHPLAVAEIPVDEVPADIDIDIDVDDIDVDDIDVEVPADIDTEEPPAAEDVPVIEDALEQITHPDAEELPPLTLTPVESVIAREQLIRLRARFAELQARITERGGDAARIETLRTQTETLNPDTWVTAEEARKGLEEFESRIRDLRAALGLRRRRRSRRGGRRRHREGGSHAGEPGQTAVENEASNSVDSEAPAGSEESERPEESDADEE